MAIPAIKKESRENKTLRNMIRMVEYPTLKFSSIAAGMISTNAIQLQCSLNHASLNARLSTNTNTIESNPHGKIRNEDGLLDGIAMIRSFGWQKDKNNLLMIAYFYYTYLPVFRSKSGILSYLNLVRYENCYRYEGIFSGNWKNQL